MDIALRAALLACAAAYLIAIVWSLTLPPGSSASGRPVLTKAPYVAIAVALMAIASVPTAFRSAVVAIGVVRLMQSAFFTMLVSRADAVARRVRGNATELDGTGKR